VQSLLVNAHFCLPLKKKGLRLSWASYRVCRWLKPNLNIFQCLSICLCDFLSVCLSICLLACPPVHLFVHKYVFLSLPICSCVRLSVCLFICLYTSAFAHLFMCAFVRLFIYLSLHTSVCLFICSFIYPSYCLSALPSICLYIHLCVSLSVLSSVSLTVCPCVCVSVCSSVPFFIRPASYSLLDIYTWRNFLKQKNICFAFRLCSKLDKLKDDIHEHCLRPSYKIAIVKFLRTLSRVRITIDGNTIGSNFWERSVASTVNVLLLKIEPMECKLWCYFYSIGMS